MGVNIKRALAIDPGERRSGLALFVGWPDEPQHSGIVWVAQAAPEETIEVVRNELPNLSALVVEEWRLYPWMAETKSWSEFETVKLIGVVEWLWRTYKRGGQTDSEYVKQGADILKPTRKMVEKRGIERHATPGGKMRHAADAEDHAWRWWWIDLQLETLK